MKKGIWKYDDNLIKVNKESRITLGESCTPITTINNVSIKREDLNPTGSYKDRGAAFRVSKALENGEKEIVVSSTGNFAISIATYSKKAKIKCHVFVPDTISIVKKNLILQLTPHIYLDKKPIKKAAEFCKAHNLTLCLQSQDNFVFEGFKTLAFEVGNFDNIFFPVSSGSLLLATYEGLKGFGLYKSQKLIAVQTTYNTYVAREFTNDYVKSIAPSIATSLNTRLRPSKLDNVIEAIKSTKGIAIIVSEDDIIMAYKDLKKEGLEEIGYETAVCFAGYKKLKGTGSNLIISTGKLR